MFKVTLAIVHVIEIIIKITFKLMFLLMAYFKKAILFFKNCSRTLKQNTIANIFTNDLHIYNACIFTSIMPNKYFYQEMY